MEWCVSGVLLGGKIALNVALPGSGSLVDFGEACYCAYNGDKVGCGISIISGLSNLVTLGFASSTKEAMKKTARESVAQFAKETMKSSSKETSKTFGKQVGKELAKGVASQATKEVWHESTKMTLKSLSQDIFLSGISSGGYHVLDIIFEDLREKLILEVLKQKPKEIAFELTKEAAKKGAREEFMKHSYKFLVNNVSVAFAKEMMKSSSKETSKTFGKQVGKELAKGVASQATKEVWHESTKMTLKSLSQDIFLSGISSGGYHVLDIIFEDLREKLILEVLKQKPKEIPFELTMEAAKKGVWEELMKRSYKFLVNDVSVALLKGGTTYRSSPSCSH